MHKAPSDKRVVFVYPLKWGTQKGDKRFGRIRHAQGKRLRTVPMKIGTGDASSTAYGDLVVDRTRCQVESWATLG